MIVMQCKVRTESFGLDEIKNYDKKIFYNYLCILKAAHKQQEYQRHI